MVVRMAEENPTWGYTRIRGALKNVGHRVGRSTIARILKAQGVPPVPERPTSWRSFLRAHWGAIAGADFFTTEVWTWRGLVTYYTVFVIDLASRRVQIAGSTPYPDDVFMHQVSRTLTAADEGALVSRRVLICDRDRKWSPAIRAQLDASGVCVVQTPFQAPNANAAERFVRSIKSECLDRLILLGEDHLRRTLAEFVAHYHRERNHQGLGTHSSTVRRARRAVVAFAGGSASAGFSTITTVRRDGSRRCAFKTDRPNRGTLRGLTSGGDAPDDEQQIGQQVLLYLCRRGRVAFVDRAR